MMLFGMDAGSAGRKSVRGFMCFYADEELSSFDEGVVGAVNLTYNALPKCVVVGDWM